MVPRVTIYSNYDLLQEKQGGDVSETVRVFDAG